LELERAQQMWSMRRKSLDGQSGQR
ncbi:MAG: hypothetical protein JWQ18_2176, partial [Conexibacter sp.]|nr:hypothetical protein [Conexibacter sp.]